MRQQPMVWAPSAHSFSRRGGAHMTEQHPVQRRRRLVPQTLTSTCDFEGRSRREPRRRHRQHPSNVEASQVDGYARGRVLLSVWSDFCDVVHLVDNGLVRARRHHSAIFAGPALAIAWRPPRGVVGCPAVAWGTDVRKVGVVRNGGPVQTLAERRVDTPGRVRPAAVIKKGCSVVWDTGEFGSVPAGNTN
jgi:hypothetical protein